MSSTKIKGKIAEKISSLKDRITKKEKQSGRLPKKRIGKKKAILVTVVLCLVAVVIKSCVFPAEDRSVEISENDVETLMMGDLAYTISTTGTVESEDSHKIYSNLSYTVKEVYADVGDEVKKGDLLCELDSSTLDRQIETQELSARLSAESAGQSVKTAQDSYNAAKSAIDNGTNSSIVSADSSVRTAYESWQKAQKTYDDYSSAMGDGYNSNLVQQDSNVKSAQLSLASAQSAYNTACSEYDELKKSGSDDSSVEDAKSRYLAAKEAYERAKAVYEEKLSVVTELEKNEGNSTGEHMENETETEAGEAAKGEAEIETKETAGSEAEGREEESADIIINSVDTTNQTNQELEAAKRELEAAKAAMDEAEATYKAAEQTYEQARQQAASTYESTLKAKKSAVESAESQLKTAQLNYDTAIQSRDAAYVSADTQLSDYAVSVDTAYAAYLAALKSHDATVVSAETSLQSSENSLRSAQISANTESAELELEHLKEDLEATKIYADADGVVTACYASVGGSGNGLLYVIEDASKLTVETNVKEYDIFSVKVGTPAIIKSDAAGNESYEGEISFIAPTTNKDAQGATDTSGEAMFSTTVSVSSQNTKLKIGTTAKVSLIIDRAENVLSASYNAVYQNESGQTCVMLLEPQSGNEVIIREVVVETGFENDTAVAVTGNGLTDGSQVISSPENYMFMRGRTAVIAASGRQ